MIKTPKMERRGAPIKAVPRGLHCFQDRTLETGTHTGALMRQASFSALLAGIPAYALALLSPDRALADTGLAGSLGFGGLAVLPEPGGYVSIWRVLLVLICLLGWLA